MGLDMTNSCKLNGSLFATIFSAILDPHTLRLITATKFSGLAHNLF